MWTSSLRSRVTHAAYSQHAGTYLMTGYPVPFEITVPDGWETVGGANP